MCVWGSDQDGAALSRGMLSVLSYGRLVARAVLGGLSQTDGRDYSLITASYGFGKDFRKGILKKGMCYGDDACFIARHRTADVLGKCSPDAGSLCDCVRKHTLGARVTFTGCTCADHSDENTTPSPPGTHTHELLFF